MTTNRRLITARLHQAWLQRLQREWRAINTECLAGKLRAPVMRIDTQPTQRLGSWHPRGRILAISQTHILAHAWHEVLATLRHEMAHQYVDEVVGGDRTAHGDAFKAVCVRLGIDAAATGSPAASDGAAGRILSKVRKLLALAESHNAHEAEAAMAAANTLLLKYNLALPGGEQRPDYTTRRIGVSAAALPLKNKLIAAILAEFFFVDCVWVLAYNAALDRDERMLEILGTPTNLELAEYVHGFLTDEIERLWRRARAGVAGGRGRKREFSAGVLMAFSEKLRDERRVNDARGLVWVGDADLEAFVAQRHPRLSKLSGVGVRRTGAHQAGREAGAALKIRRPIAASANRGRRLTSG